MIISNRKCRQSSRLKLEKKSNKNIIHNSNNLHKDKENYLNLKNNLYDFFRQKLFSDITLNIKDVYTGNLIVVIDSHKVILSSCARYFKSLLNNQFKENLPLSSSNDNISINGNNNSNRKHQIDIYLNFNEDGLTKEIVYKFFGLFYSNYLTLTKDDINFIKRNIFYIYDLCIYFDYISLSKYCYFQILEIFNRETFHLLYNFYNISDYTSINICTLPKEKQDMFIKLAYWYQTCYKNSNPNDNTMDDGGEYDEDGEEEEEEENEEDEYHNILNDIDNHFILLNKSDDRNIFKSWYTIDDHQTTLNTYYCICKKCLYSSSTDENTYVYQGDYCKRFKPFIIDYNNNNFEFLFRIKKSIDIDYCNMLELKQRINNRDIANNVTYNCLVSCSLLSKEEGINTVYKNNNNINLSLFTDMIDIPFSDESYSFTGKCDLCKIVKPIYIFSVNINIQNKNEIEMQM